MNGTIITRLPTKLCEEMGLLDLHSYDGGQYVTHKATCYNVNLEDG